MLTGVNRCQQASRSKSYRQLIKLPPPPASSMAPLGELALLGVFIPTPESLRSDCGRLTMLPLKLYPELSFLPKADPDSREAQLKGGKTKNGENLISLE
jgi:hypothetical protein